MPTYHRFSFLLAASFLLGLGATPAFARPAPAPQPVAQQHDGLRCGSNLIELSVTKADVVNKCGAPLTQDQHVETRGRAPAFVTVTVDEWTYKPDSGSFMRLLRFENNRLVSVQALAK